MPSDRARIVQGLLLGLVLFGVVQLVVSVVYAHVIDGYVGVTSATAVAPLRVRIDGVAPRSPVERDGLRAGDVVDLRAMSPDDRMDWTNYLKVGTRYHVPVLRNGTRSFVDVDMNRNINDDPGWRHIRWQFYIRFTGLIVMLGIAGFLILRRPGSADVALLSAAIVLDAVGEDFAPIGAWDLRSGALTTVGYAAWPFLAFGGLALLATYALRFAGPPSRLRRTMTGATYAVAAAIAATLAFGYVGYWAGIIDNTFGLFGSQGFADVVGVAPYALPLACALLAIRDARGAERSRIAWATGALAILYVGPIVSQVFAQLGFDTPFTYALQNFSFPLAAAGLAYALLGPRLLDVGFVLNRAAVFAAMSLVVVGAFSLMEWALGGWLASASRNTNVLVSALLALGLGLGVHPIHALVDRFIDSVFFRKRHEAERTLRRFAKEAAFITDPAIVVERTSAILRDHTDCTSVRVLLDDGAGAYGGVTENDPALVTLRESHAVVRLRGLETELSGDSCYPMSAGGRLIGALVVGPKRLGESFAPDEREAISELAHGVGIALALLTGAPAPNDRSPSLARLAAAIEALPDDLALKLRGTEPPAAYATHRRDAETGHANAAAGNGARFADARAGARFEDAGDIDESLPGTNAGPD